MFYIYASAIYEEIVQSAMTKSCFGLNFYSWNESDSRLTQVCGFMGSVRNVAIYFVAKQEISWYTLKQNKKNALQYIFKQSKKYLNILWSRAIIHLTQFVSWIEIWVGERLSIALRCTISHWNLFMYCNV